MIGLSRLKQTIADVSTGGMQAGTSKVQLKLCDAQRIEVEYGALIAERDAALSQNAELVAKVDAYRATLEYFVSEEFEWNDPRDSMIDDIHNLLDLPPPQCLRDVKAEAVQSVNLDAYDAGHLNDFGGGNVGWWQDYMRSELGAAHDFYQSQIDQYAEKARSGNQ